MFHIMTLTKIARICTYISLAAPLIAARSLFFPFITGKILFFRTFTELALVAVAGAVLYGEIPLKRVLDTLKRPIFIAISLFTALFTLSAFTAQIPSFAIWSNFERGEGAWQIIHYFLFFFLITLLFRNKDDWKRLAGAQAIIGALVALYAVGQAINWPSWIIDPPTGRVSGTLGNPAYMGIYMAFSACFALWMTLEDKNKRLFWGIIAIFEAIMFLMAQNRGSYAGAGIGIILMIFLWFMQKKRAKKSYAALGITLIAVIFGASILILTVKGGNAIQDFQPRLWTWESAFAGTIEQPLLGSGAEHFPFVFDAYYNPKHYQIESWFDRAHSTPLEYLTIGGIPLFLAYFGIFTVLYLRLLRKKNEGLVPFFAGIPLIYLVNGLILFETIPLYLILLVALGLIDAFTDDFKEPSRAEGARYGNTPMSGSHALFAAVGALILFSLYATIYVPLKKNLLILNTMRTDGKTDIEVFQGHDNSLSYSSPVGDQEGLQGLLTFTVSYFDYLRANGLAKEVSKEKIAEIMKLNARWYDRLGPYAPGLKIVYIRITGLLAAYQETKDVAYLKEADRLIAEGTAASPTRIEFVRFALASAALRGDRGTYEQAYKKGKILLPDLGWEPEMTKFAY